MLQRFLAPAVLVATLGVAAPASALPITGIDATDVGTTWSVLFGGNVNGVDVSDLSATADLTLASFDGDTAVFNVALTNTTGGDLDSRVSAFGFLTTPNLVGGSSTGLFSNFRIGTFPNQTPIEACVTEGNTCQGGSNGGLTTGSSGSFVVTLEFASLVPDFDLDGLAVRYQSIEGTSDGLTFDGASGTGTGTSQSIPEPTTMLLLGSGLVGAGWLRRRRA